MIITYLHQKLYFDLLMDYRLNIISSNDSLESLNTDCLGEIFKLNSPPEILSLRQVSVKLYSIATTVLLLQNQKTFLKFQRNLFIRWSNDSSFINGKINPSTLRISIRHLDHSVVERIYGLFVIRQLTNDHLSFKFGKLIIENYRLKGRGGVDFLLASRLLHNTLAISPFEFPNHALNRLIETAKKTLFFHANISSGELKYYLNTHIKTLLPKLSEKEISSANFIPLSLKERGYFINSFSKMLKDFPNLIKPSDLIEILDANRKDGHSWCDYYSSEILSEVLFSSTHKSTKVKLTILKSYFETFKIYSSDKEKAKDICWISKTRFNLDTEDELDISKIRKYALKKIIRELKNLNNNFYFYYGEKLRLKPGVDEALVILIALVPIFDSESITAIIELFSEELFLLPNCGVGRARELVINLASKFTPKNVLYILEIFINEYKKTNLNKIFFALDLLSSLATFNLTNKALDEKFYNVFKSIIDARQEVYWFTDAENSLIEFTKNVAPRLDAEKVSIFLQKTIAQPSGISFFVKSNNLLAKIIFMFPVEITRKVFQSEIAKLKQNVPCEPEILSIIAPALDQNDINWIVDNILHNSVMKIKHAHSISDPQTINTELNNIIHLAPYLTRLQFLDILEPLLSDLPMFNKYLFNFIEKIKFTLGSDEILLISEKLGEHIHFGSNTSLGYYTYESLKVLSKVNSPEQIDAILIKIQQEFKNINSYQMATVLEYLMKIAPRITREYKSFLGIITFALNLFSNWLDNKNSEIIQFLTTLVPKLTFDETKLVVEKVIPIFNAYSGFDSAKDLLCLMLTLRKCTIADLENAGLGGRPYAEFIRFYAEAHKAILT